MTDVVNTRIFGSRQKLWRLETGQGPYKWSEVQALADIYRVDLETRSQWVDWAMRAGESGWWENYSTAVNNFRFGLYIELEQAASAITVCSGDVIHGLAQTERYHRAVVQLDPTKEDADTTEQFVSLRAEREAVTLHRATPVRLNLVLSESALCFNIGGEAVMREQLAHLRELDGRAHVEVSVLLFSAGGHAAMRGPYTLLQFDDPDVPDVVYIESLDGGRFIEDAKVVQRFIANATLLSASAVPIEEWINEQHRVA
ncbi:helix-turn-helix transcriptional regulator [Kineosporia succinea]